MHEIRCQPFARNRHAHAIARALAERSSRSLDSARDVRLRMSRRFVLLRGMVVFVELANTKIELLEPLGEGSPIAKFLERNPDGGIHHLCYEVDDIRAARDALKAQGARVLGDGEPKIGAHGKPVLFLHPKDFTGTLIELEQV